MIQGKWDLFYLGLCQYVSSASKDPSTKVGAVLVAENNSVLSTGWNGFPASMEDRDEWWNDREAKLDRVVHAELNCLLYANRKILPEGTCLFTWPLLPCHKCAVIMLQAGVRRFVAPEPTRSQIERWGSSFAKTRQYLMECNSELVEYAVH